VRSIIRPFAFGFPASACSGSPLRHDDLLRISSIDGQSNDNLDSQNRRFARAD